MNPVHILNLFSILVKLTHLKMLNKLRKGKNLQKCSCWNSFQNWKVLVEGQWNSEERWPIGLVTCNVATVGLWQHL